MLQSMGSQRVGHHLVTEQQQQTDLRGYPHDHYPTFSVLNSKFNGLASCHLAKKRWASSWVSSHLYLAGAPARGLHAPPACGAGDSRWGLTQTQWSNSAPHRSSWSPTYTSSSGGISVRGGGFPDLDTPQNVPDTSWEPQPGPCMTHSFDWENQWFQPLEQGLAHGRVSVWMREETSGFGIMEC